MILNHRDVEVELVEFAYDQLGVAARSVLADTQLATEAYTRDPAGRLLAVQGPAGGRFVLTDGLGSVMGLVDDDGTMVASYRYSPFGETLEADGVAAQANPWRFAGEYLDATGMYKIGQRYYHPGLGRWTQPDPIFDPVDPKLWNPYTYVGNDPINYTDPSGMSPCRNDMLRDATSFLGFFGDRGRNLAQEVTLKAGMRFGPTMIARAFQTAKQGTDALHVKPTTFMKTWAKGSLGTMVAATAFNIACGRR